MIHSPRYCSMTTEVFGIESPWVLLAFADDIDVVGNTVIMERDPKSVGRETCTLTKE